MVLIAMRIIWFFLIAACAAAQQPGTIAIDKQEWRGAPVRHLYIHGLLNGDTAFQVFMPDPAQWKGRLFHYLQGGIGGSESEGVKMGNHLYALANGGVYVESSQGHIGTTFYEPNNTPGELAYEASYAVVQYAKSRCVEIYGQEPKYSYIFGGSGGGVRSTGLLERFPKVYDGAVPIVGAGNLFYFTYLQSMYEMYRPLIQGKVAALAEATRVPGQGDPFAVLDNERQKEAFRMLLTTGYPRNSVWMIRPLSVGIIAFDFLKYKAYPGYFDDFWNKPGYAGTDGECKAELVEGIEGTVKTLDAAKRILSTDVNRPNHELFGYTIVFTSGQAKGQWRRV
ncbi:MAG: tannase/feruloyl esterase family alpha/beta hydrolase, partial [Acidobacteria bacterium]|nr:tannase/feruloyl esterase family alpha/beta hydrolase [Acidobacteriota bacterium]